MQIKVVAVGKLKEKFWREACAEYSKRLSRYVAISIQEVDDVDPARVGTDANARAKEAQNISAAMPSDSSNNSRCVICLDRCGKEVSSEEFAHKIEQFSTSGLKTLVFVVGGSTGIDENFKKSADELLSFGKITLPHNLARVVLLEQIYRAFKIIKGEPYHK